jgi:hypothetical protein
MQSATIPQVGYAMLFFGVFMKIISQPRRMTIWYLVGATLIAGLSGGQAAVAAIEAVPQADLSVPFYIAQETPNPLFKGLPRVVAEAIRQDVARRTGIDSQRVRILRYSRQTWSDGCLGLGRSDELCTEALTPGWRVTAAADGQTWIYRTDIRGSNVRLETGKTSNTRLPRSLANAVLQEAADRFQVDKSDLEIVAAERREWPDGCLGLADSEQFCTQATVPGWRVTVTGNGRRWVYRTNATGSVVKFDKRDSRDRENDTELPQRVADRVLEEAAEVLGLSRDRLQIIQAREETWSGGCLGLPEPGEACTRNLVPGWEVTVRGDRQFQQLVYRTNRSGSAIRLDRKASNWEGNGNSRLPNSIADVILRDARKRSGISLSRLRIASAQSQIWSDSCLGLGGPAEICATQRVKGWRVTVEGGNRRWIYHTDASGSRIILNPNGTARS